MASVEGFIHEAEGICAGGTGHFRQALYKEAPVLVVSNCQGSLLATSCQI